MTRLSLCSACLAAFLWLGPSARAQPPTTTLAGQVELARLVDTAAQRLHVNMEYDAASLKGQVTLRLEGGLSDDELWQLVNRVLAARGFTTVTSPGSPPSYTVVKLADAPAAAGMALPAEGVGPPAPGAGGAGGPLAGYRTVVVRAHNRTARDLVDQIGRGLGGGSGGRGAGPGAGNATALGDSGLIVISDLSPRVEQTERLLGLLDTPGGRTVVEQVPAENLGAQQLLTLVTQVAAKREAVSGEKLPGEWAAAADGSGLLLVAPQSAVPQWRALVGQLDKREAVRTETYTPRHFAAGDVARLIDQTITPGSGTGGGAGVAGDERFRVVIDELTGSLVVTGTPTQQEAVRALLDRLAHVPASARRPVRTFVIKNRPVDEVAGVLRELLRAGVLDAAAAGGGEGSTDGGSTPQDSQPPGANLTPMPPRPASSTPGDASSLSPFTAPQSSSSSGLYPRSSAQSAASSSSFRGGPTSLDEPPVTLTVDKGTNTLIAVGEPRVLEQIERLLVTLDVRQPQVMLEVLLVTLSDGQTMDMGVELQKLSISGGTLFRLSSLFGLGTTTGGGDRDGPTGASGFTGVVLNPGDFSVVLRALETLNDGRAVSMPRLLVGNNEQATLDSTVQQPYASLNASNTVSTTSFGGTQDAGTVVTIQPQIAEGDHLLLQYSVSLSAFTGPASNPALPPPRQQNRVQSTASIPDGFTVVVGGIEIQNKSRAVSQIPFIGSIPIIGEAFKSRNKSDSRSRFYVFIRANILRGSGAGGGFEDLKYASERGVRDAGVDDGWPELTPRVIR